MRELSEIRAEIDAVDEQIKRLMMKRLDCSGEVVETKIRDKNFSIFRADREKAMLEKLEAGVEQSRKKGYLSVVRKITETSRMYQYGILFDQIGELYEQFIGDTRIPASAKGVDLMISRRSMSNALSSILSMIEDYGYTIDRIQLLEGSSQMRRFSLTVLGDLEEIEFKKMLLQLSMESEEFKITGFI